MSVTKSKNFSYLKGPKGDKGDKGDPGSGISATTGRITYNPTNKILGFNETGLATQSYVNTAVNNLLNGAPLVLDTLNELAAAINNNPTFVTDITASLNGKLSLAGGTMTGALILNADPVSNLGAATKQYVDNATSSIVTSYNDLTDKPELFSGSYNELTNKPTIPTDINQLNDVDGLLNPSTGSGPTNWSDINFNGGDFDNVELDNFDNSEYLLSGNIIDYPTIVSAPSTSVSPGETGQIAYDNDYVYICIATNTWKRSALSSW